MLVTLSIVSHGHSQTVKLILGDLNAYKGRNSLCIILTLNSPELETATVEELREVSVWPIQVISNKHPHGFGANHNCAFKGAQAGLWCVINPDVRLPRTEFLDFTTLWSNKHVGLEFPKQKSPEGVVLDYTRDLVTPWSLLQRYLLKTHRVTTNVDWVSGCFMAFRSDVYQILSGFDEKYFLYCEDVDICLRLQLAGYKMAEADFSIIHDTRRGTLKKWDHFKWHVSSLLKLWCSRVFWIYLWNRHKIRQR